MARLFKLFCFGFALTAAAFLIYPQALRATEDTDTVTLTATMPSTITVNITAGDTVAFGSLTAGVPVAAPATGTIVAVATNAPNGYTLGLSDGVAGSDSALVHTDTTTRITDVTSGTIASPASWGVSTGLGITMYAADTNKENGWGTGTTYDDANNKYAAIPQNATTAHTVTGAVVGSNTSSWAFKLDVPADQKIGNYSSGATPVQFTATAVLE